MARKCTCLLGLGMCLSLIALIFGIDALSRDHINRVESDEIRAYKNPALCRVLGFVYRSGTGKSCRNVYYDLRMAVNATTYYSSSECGRKGNEEEEEAPTSSPHGSSTPLPPPLSSDSTTHNDSTVPTPTGRLTSACSILDGAVLPIGENEDTADVSARRKGKRGRNRGDDDDEREQMGLTSAPETNTNLSTYIHDVLDSDDYVILAQHRFAYSNFFDDKCGGRESDDIFSHHPGGIVPCYYDRLSDSTSEEEVMFDGTTNSAEGGDGGDDGADSYTTNKNRGAVYRVRISGYIERDTTYLIYGSVLVTSGGIPLIAFCLYNCFLCFVALRVPPPSNAGPHNNPNRATANDPHNTNNNNNNATATTTAAHHNTPGHNEPYPKYDDLPEIDPDAGEEGYGWFVSNATNNAYAKTVLRGLRRRKQRNIARMLEKKRQQEEEEQQETELQERCPPGEEEKDAANNGGDGGGAVVSSPSNHRDDDDARRVHIHDVELKEEAVAAGNAAATAVVHVAAQQQEEEYPVQPQYDDEDNETVALEMRDYIPSARSPALMSTGYHSRPVSAGGSMQSSRLVSPNGPFPHATTTANTATSSSSPAPSSAIVRNSDFPCSPPPAFDDHNHQFGGGGTQSPQYPPISVRSEDDLAPRDCPICFEPLHTHASVLLFSCGHVVCEQCADTFLSKVTPRRPRFSNSEANHKIIAAGLRIKCPVCRHVARSDELAKVLLGPTEDIAAPPAAAAAGEEK